MSRIRWSSEKICLLKSRFDDEGNLTDSLGGSYCGNLCFGMGTKGTYERKKATCGTCLDNYERENKKKRKL